MPKASDDSLFATGARARVIIMPVIKYCMFAAGVSFITFWREAMHSYDAKLLLVREINII